MFAYRTSVQEYLQGAHHTSLFLGRGDVTVEVYRGTMGRRCDCRGVQGHCGEEM